jgi:hypothetical protein
MLSEDQQGIVERYGWLDQAHGGRIGHPLKQGSEVDARPEPIGQEPAKMGRNTYESRHGRIGKPRG